MHTTFIVDGYNLLHRSYPERLADTALAEAREFLEERLRRFQTAGDRSVLVVFDGRSGGTRRASRLGGFRVMFSGSAETADDVVLELARRLEGRGDVVVVTSDLSDIGHRIRGLRCRHLTSEEFAAVLERADEPPSGEPAEKPRRISGPEVDRWLREFDMHPEADEPP